MLGLKGCTTTAWYFPLFFSLTVSSRQKPGSTFHAVPRKFLSCALGSPLTSTFHPWAPYPLPFPFPFSSFFFCLSPSPPLSSFFPVSSFPFLFLVPLLPVSPFSTSFPPQFPSLSHFFLLCLPFSYFFFLWLLGIKPRASYILSAPSCAPALRTQFNEPPAWSCEGLPSCSFQSHPITPHPQPLLAALLVSTSEVCLLFPFSELPARSSLSHLH